MASGTLLEPVAPPAAGPHNVADLLAELGDVPPERVLVRPSPGSATEADLLVARAAGGPSCELVDGVLVAKTMGFFEARVSFILAMLLEEFVTRELDTGSLPLGPVGQRALLHGHCHQKSFGAMGSVETALKLVPGLAVETVDSSCCGMAGSFGYGADTIDVSLKMAELSLLPAVRSAPADAIIVADGTSCRHQIGDGAGRKALHVARVLAMGVEAARKAATA